MTSFYLDRDFNLAIGKRLWAHGHEVSSAHERGLELAGDAEILDFAGAADAIVLTHNERRFVRLAPVPGHAGVLFIPQASQEDVPRIAEAIHRLAASDRTLSGELLCFGLRSGWAPLTTAGARQGTDLV